MFRCIAAEWKNVDPDSVTDSLRQQAKQVQPEGKWDEDELACTPTCVPLFADLLWYNLRNGSKVVRGANGSGGERRSVLHRDLQIQIQRCAAVSLSPLLPARYTR